MGNKHRIIAFVAPDCSGKTALMVHLLEAFPEAFEPLLTHTSRAWRDPSDDLFYRTDVDSALLRRWIADGLAAEFVDHGRSVYVSLRVEVDAVLRRANLVGALTEDGVNQFRDNGYDVIAIRVEPRNRPDMARDDQARAADDARRRLIPVDYQYELVNDFAPGGLARTIEELDLFLTGVIYHD